LAWPSSWLIVANSTPVAVGKIDIGNVHAAQIDAAKVATAKVARLAGLTAPIEFLAATFAQ